MTMPFIMAGMPQRFRIDRPKARGTQDLLGPNRKKASHSRHRACAVNIKAFKENTKIQDWRINEMVQVAHKYFTNFLTKGDANVAQEIFDSECIHVDQVWAPAHPTVGVEGMMHYIADLKAAFPDFWVEIKEISTCDTNSIWVWYEGAATGLGDYHGHRASHHASIFSGINIFKFNADRSKILEMHVYRSAFAEDKQELVEKVPEGGFRELRLRRLV